MKPKLLCILHRSPPTHGAAKVGDFISESKKLNEKFDCQFITIKSSNTIGNIGKINFKKLYLVVKLYIKIFIALIFFRPDKIYFTASINSIAFYRDILLSTLWKCYKLFKKTDIYYHYHTKGINKFVSVSKKNLKLTNFFLKDVNLILLSPLLKDDFKKIDNYKNILYLPNGVENNLTNKEFISYLEEKKFHNINILYLSNMIKSKGYFEILKLANLFKNKKYHFHFAGGWQDKEDEKEFFKYIKKNNLEKIVTFHGFVNGEQKRKLFIDTSLFVFPTRYKNEAFPLTILESLSYGVPILSTNEGSIPFIVDEKSGIIVSNLNDLSIELDNAIDNLINKKTSIYCRKRYLKNFTLDKFENNLVEVFK